jgi:glutathione-independent formaldehyde dehydrogenase
LLAAYSALLKGASEVYVVDRAPERLKVVEKMSATPVDFTKGNAAEQIVEMRRKNPKITDSRRPEEIQKMPGVMCAIDAVGYQARSTQNPGGGVNEHARRGDYLIPLGGLWDKGVSIGAGQTPVKKYNVHLRDMILPGRARPSFIISHRLPLSKAPEAYARFDTHGVGEGREYTKVVLKPDLDRLGRAA